MWLGRNKNVSSIVNHIEVWETELKTDLDWDFLLRGIRERFRLIDRDSTERAAEKKS